MHFNKMAIKLVCWMVTILLIVVAVLPSSYALFFNDVTHTLSNEKFEAIMYASDNAIMLGTGSLTFSPNSYLNRAQIVQILYNISGKPNRTKDGTLISNVSIPFTDVPVSSWYYKAVCWAYKEGLAQGTTSTKFSPSDPIIKEQLATFFYRYETQYCNETPDVQSLINSHTDYLNISSYARSSMNWALTYAVIQTSTPTQALQPKSKMSRSDVSTFICRYNKNAVGFYRSREQLGFANPSGTFTLTDNARNKLYDILVAAYGVLPATAKYINLLAKLGKSTSYCHGMSFVTFLDSIGRIDFNWSATGGTANTMHSITSMSIGDVNAGINLYQLLGYVACDYRTEYHSPTESKVTLLQQEIATHGPVLFCYFWHKADGSTAGHAVIVTNIRKTGSNKYRLTVVDPNINTGLVAKEITATPHDIKMNSSILTTIGFYSSNDMNNLSFLDMDSDYNNVALNGLTR